MELRVLRYFLAVAREESISDAADFLHITQPTLSRQLMDLEEELGKQLLIRGKRNRKIALTEDGMRLRKRAEEIIALADKTEAEFLAEGQDISGDVYIGCDQRRCLHWLRGKRRHADNSENGSALKGRLPRYPFPFIQRQCRRCFRTHGKRLA